MADSENKTKATGKSVREFIGTIEDEQTQKDCKTLCTFMEKLTGYKPVLWGDAIVGFGSYHYKYASGREGDSCLTGFSPRKQNISIYANCSLSDYQGLLKSLGKFKQAKACLYVKKLEDINLDVLGKIILLSIRHTREMYP